jgi:hypothetical protein
MCLYMYPHYVARQRLDKDLSIFARQQLCKNRPIVARQRLCRNVTAVTNTHSTIEDLLDASFWKWPVSYRGKEAISSSQKFLLYVYCLDEFRGSESVMRVCVTPHSQFVLTSSRERQRIFVLGKLLLISNCYFSQRYFKVYEGEMW